MQMIFLYTSIAPHCRHQDLPTGPVRKLVLVGEPLGDVVEFQIFRFTCSFTAVHEFLWFRHVSTADYLPHY